MWILLVGLLALFIFGLRGSAPTTVREDTSVPEFGIIREDGSFLTSLDEDGSNIFRSPEASEDEGIYYQQNPPTFDQSIAEIAKVQDRLPINVPNISTDSGIEASVNIWLSEYTRQDVLNVHIEGINYHEQEASTNNPQYVAFTEALQRAKEALERFNVDTSKLLVSVGKYIVETANNWARVSGIL